MSILGTGPAIKADWEKGRSYKLLCKRLLNHGMDAFCHFGVQIVLIRAGVKDG